MVSRNAWLCARRECLTAKLRFGSRTSAFTTARHDHIRYGIAGAARSDAVLSPWEAPEQHREYRYASSGAERGRQGRGRTTMKHNSHQR
jgi:hypothetical protein